MIVLGIDPGTARPGYGIVSRDGNAIRLLDFGCFETTNDRPLSDRLALIHAGISDLIETHVPEAVGVERRFFNKTVQTACAVGQARGVIQLAIIITSVAGRHAPGTGHDRPATNR